jgi:hypothetical protein
MLVRVRDQDKKTWFGIQLAFARGRTALLCAYIMVEEKPTWPAAIHAGFPIAC